MNNKCQKFLFTAVMLFSLAGCAKMQPATAEGETPIGVKIQNLIKNYIDENGQYTKKTTICFNEDAHKEMDKYFHCGQVQAQRTTYYDDQSEQLLMAEPDGTLDASYGGYRLVEDKIFRFTSTDETTLENMFDGEHINQQKLPSYTNRTHLYDAFVNLSKLAVDGYFESTDWEYSEQYKQYTHNINPGDGETENDDRYYPDILGFAAPMLKSNYVGSNYIHIQSIGFSERYDADANKYLSIRIYLVDEDKGKLTGDCGETTMSEARIYKGIRPVGDEDLSTAYYLKSWIDDEAVKNEKMTYNESNKQYELENVNLKINERVKIWNTKDEWIGNFQHDISGYVEESIDSDGNYKALFAGNYGFYYKPEDVTTYISAPTTLTFYFAGNWDWGTLKFYQFGSSSKTTWENAPALTKVADSAQYQEGQYAPLYTFSVAKSDVSSYPKFIIYGSQQTKDMEWSWYKALTYNAFYFVWDNANSLSSWTYIPA